MTFGSHDIWARMCDQSLSVFSFKGVVVVVVVLSVIFGLSDAVPPPQVVAKTGFGGQASFPYCVYLEPSQEIDCSCDDWETDDGLVTFPTDAFLPTNNEAEAKSIRLHSCQKIQLHLDFRPLPKHLKKLRFENIGQEVRIGGVSVRANDSVELSFKNVTQQLFISGEILCPDCDRVETIRSSLEIMIVDAANVTLESLVVDGTSVDFRLKMRSGSNLEIWDSFFGNLSSSSIEIFNVARVEIVHSEFHNVTAGAIVLNGGVKEVSVKDSLMENNILEELSPTETNVTLTCTTSPMQTDPLDPKCSESSLGRQLNRILKSGVESTGAIVIAVVSGILLLAAVGVLFFLHRHGKLEQYL